MAIKLILSLVILLVVGAMVADQIRCNGMRLHKWGIAGVLAVGLTAHVWLG